MKTPTHLDDHPEDSGMYQGGGWDKGVGSAARLRGGSKNDYPLMAAPSSADLPPRKAQPAPRGHRCVGDSRDDDPRCLVCGKRSE